MQSKLVEPKLTLILHCVISHSVRRSVCRSVRLSVAEGSEHATYGDWPCLNKGTTFASLKTEGTVSVMMDKLMMCVTGAMIASAPSRRKKEETSTPTAFFGSRERS